MSKNQKQIAQLEKRIRDEERNFLIEVYAHQLVQILQETSENLDDKAVESFIVAQRRVKAELAVQISDLLETNGREIDRKAPSVQSSKGDGFVSVADVADDNGSSSNIGSLFVEVELPDEAEELSCDYEETAELDEEEGDGLFDSDSELEDVEDGKYETEGYGDEEGLFGDHHEPKVEDSLTPAKKQQRARRSADDELADEDDGEVGDGVDSEVVSDKEDEAAFEAASTDDGEQEKELSTKDQMAKSKQELGQQRRQRLVQMQAREKEQQAQEEHEIDDELLDALTYQISLEDLEKYLNITVKPVDRSALDKRFRKKLQEPCVKMLLQNAEKSRIAYALVPRLPRFIKDGKANLNSVATLLRSHPQVFENVTHMIKYKAEPFFLSELPRLDWAIISCEVLPETKAKNYNQQRLIMKSYAQKHQTTEMRVRHRTLVEALFDMVVVQLVINEKLLINSVEMTDSKTDRMNYACINNSEKGIRIGDLSRQQTHPQLGICASW